MHHHR